MAVRNKANRGFSISSSEMEGASMTGNTIVVKNQPIRTDWIHQIQRGEENGTLTCTIWFSIGPFGVFTFKGSDAKLALKLLADHPKLQA